MDHLDDQDLDLVCDLGSEYGLVDLMLSIQEDEHLAELIDYLGPLLERDDVSEADLSALLAACGGEVFEATARESVSKLLRRAEQALAGQVYRPTPSA